ncbi:stalk domain-containing protein [Paenibacillus sp. MBLB4367]|uniref:stalk domain-containing protein n=1 Tax=Paenibacillus sp. MBLB4367 TaxID=3384767 RepID=UPI0039080EBF
MKKIHKVLAASVMAAVLSGGTGAAAAGLAGEGVYGSGESSQLLTNVMPYAGTGDFGDRAESLAKATFRTPQSIAVTPDGTLYVSDARNNALRKISGSTVLSFAGVSKVVDMRGFPIGGLQDGKPDESFFQSPSGIAIDGKGNVYVADTENNAIRKVDAGGNVTTVAGDGIIGDKNGKGKDARFHHPGDVAVTADGTVYVADTLNHSIRKITTDGTVSTLNALSMRAVEKKPGTAEAAGDFEDGPIGKAKFNEPSGLALDEKGNLYVSDTGNQRIRYIDFAAGTVTTAAGAGEAGKSLYAPGDFADGAAAKARFNFPVGLGMTKEGGLLIADSLNHSIRYLYKGAVQTIAGDSGQFSGSDNGVDRVASFNKPSDVAEGADGSIYVTDAFNNQIRRVIPYRLPADLAGGDAIKVVYETKQVEFDTLPELSNGRTMVPVRAIAEAAGFTVEYIDEGELILLKKGGITVEMAIGRETVRTIENGRQDDVRTIDAAPYKKDGRTLVPVRFFAEQIGLDVQWNQARQTAILRLAVE